MSEAASVETTAATTAPEAASAAAPPSPIARRVEALRKLAGSDPGGQPGLLAFLDVLAGTQLAADAGGKRYASQREKIESFIDAEFGEEMLDLVNRAVAELA